MNQSIVRKNNISKGKFEDELIEAAKRNDTAFWLKSAKVKRELNSKKLISNIPEAFLLQPKIFKYLLKNMDTIEELKKLPFKTGQIDEKILKVIVDNFENYYDPISFLPKIKNSQVFCQVVAACQTKKVLAKIGMGLLLVMDKLLMKDKQAVIQLLKYFAKVCKSNDELCLILSELPDEMNNVFADQCLECTSYVFTALDDEDFSINILRDPEFKKNKKLFVKTI